MATALWQEIRREDIKSISIRPHAVPDEVHGRFAIGYAAVMFLRDGAVERARQTARPQRHLQIPSASADTVRKGRSLTNALFQATAVALNDIREKRADLALLPWRVTTHDNHLGRALAYTDQPEKWEHLPSAAMEGREEFILAVERWGRKPYVKNLDQRRSKEARLMKRLVKPIEERLVLGQFDRLRRSRRPRPMQISAEDLRELWDDAGIDGTRAPPVLEALVAHWRAKEFSHEDIANRLGIATKVSYEAQSRWRKRIKRLGASENLVEAIEPVPVPVARTKAPQRSGRLADSMPEPTHHPEIQVKPQIPVPEDFVRTLQPGESPNLTKYPTWWQKRVRDLMDPALH